MALINVREVYPGVSLGLWQMDETVEELFESYSFVRCYQKVLEQFKSDARKLEFLSVHVLLRQMLSMAGCTEAQILEVGGIRHNHAGKPLLNGYHVSVSHTKGYVALMLSKTKDVAVDIEYYSNRVQRIATKFLRKNEKAVDLDSLLIHWCSKETVYKLFSGDQLKYAEMRVRPFDVMADWVCEVENLKSHQRVNVDFELTMEFVLTYAMR